MKDIADRIDKQIRLSAAPSRVWRALIDTQEFGHWFGVRLQGPWIVGAPMKGHFDGGFSQAQIDVALQGLGLPSAPIAQVLPEVFCVVQAIEPESRFCFRWIPYGLDAGIDPQTEPMTQVEFRLEPDAAGTLLSVTESGFDQVPLERRKRAFLMNSGGWTAQLENITKHLTER